MAGAPSIAVKLDDGTGAFAYDITQHLRLAEEVQIQRGRGDEFAEVQPSMLGLTLENTDARFTFGGFAGNLIPNPSFETDTSTWASSTGSTLARTTAQKFAGLASMSITSAGATADAYAPGTGVSGYAVTAQATYSAQIRTKAATTARTITLALYWYTAAGAGIGAADTVQAVNSTTGWTQLVLTKQAPATAAFGALQVIVNATVAAEVHYLDAVMVEKRDSPGAFIPPAFIKIDTPIKVSVTDSRVNMASNPSVETNTNGWTNHNTGVTGGIWATSTTWAKVGTTSLRHAGTSGVGLIGGSDLYGFIGSYTLPADGAVGYAVTAGKAYTASTWVNVIAGPPASSPGIWQEIFFFDVGLNQIKQVNGPSVEQPVSTGVQRCYATATAPTGAVWAQAVIVMASRSPSIYMEFYADAVLFEQTQLLGDYFDGTITGYQWNGTAHASVSSGAWSDRFTGYVQTWPTDWPDASDLFAVARITATDRMSKMSRRTLRSIIEEEVLLDGPTAYYTLGEPTGGTTAGDTSGNTGQALGQSGAGAAVVFGSATGPGTDALTAAQFTNGGKSLQSPISQGALATGVSGFALECFFSATAVGAGGGLLIDAITAQLGIDSSGNLFVQGSPGGAATSSPSYLDGLTHHVIGYYTGSNMVIYVDGVSAATNAVSGTMTAYPINGVGVSGSSGTFVTGSRGGAITGVIAHAALYLTPPTPTRILSHANAGLNGFNTDTSDQRIARYAAYAGIAVADQVLEVGANTNVPHLDITGMSVLAAMQKVMEAEAGLLFIRGDGKLVMQNRSHRALQIAADLTVTTNDIAPGAVPTVDMQLVTNYVTASAGTTGAVQVAKNQASIDSHDKYPADLAGLLVSTDEQAFQQAAWRVGTYAEPKARMNNVPMDLLTLPLPVGGVQALELSDRFKITGLPAQAFNGTTTADLIIEGWTETISATSWDIAFNTSSWSVAQAWLLDDTTYSVLGSTTILGL